MNSELHTLCFRHSSTAMMRQQTASAAMVMTGPQPTKGIFASTSVTPASFLDTVVERFGSRYRPGKRHRGNRGRTDMWRFGFARPGSSRPLLRPPHRLVGSDVGVLTPTLLPTTLRR